MKQNQNPTDGNHYTDRLTKREYFAAMALQGIWANPQTFDEPASTLAVKAADKLIESLNNQTK